MGVYVAMVVVGVVATWPLTASLATAVPSNLIDSMEATWIFGWIAHALGNDPAGVFDGNIFHPADSTLAFAENLLGVAVFVSPVYAISGNVVLTTNVAYLLVLAASGYGIALLIREVTGQWTPAIIAGAAVVASPYEVMKLTHTHVIATHLIPFILLVLVRMAKNGPSVRRTSLLALLVALQFWSSMTGGMIAIVGVGAWAIVAILWSKDRGRVVLHGAAAAIVAGALIAPLFFVYRSVQQAHPEYQRPAEEVLVYSVEPRSFLAPGTGGGVFDEEWHRLRDRFGGYPDAAWEKWLFPGLWLLLAGSGGLAIGAVVALRRRPILRWPPAVLGAALLCVGGFTMSLGPRWSADPDGFPLPFLVVNKLIPGVGMRVPGRYAVAVVLGLAVLGGCALAMTKGRWRRVALAGSLLLLTAETVPARMRIAQVPRITEAHRSVAQLGGAVLQLPTYELDPNGTVTVASAIREPIQLYLSTAHFRPVVNGYAAFVPTQTLDILAAVQDFPSEPGLRALRAVDVKTVVVEASMVTGTPWERTSQRLDSWPGVVLRWKNESVRVYDISRAELVSP